MEHGEMAEAADRITEQLQEEHLPHDPLRYIQENWQMSDEELMLMFGTDSTTQAAMLRQHPEWRSAVRELEGLMP